MRIFLYARVSDEAQDTDLSISAQLKEMYIYAKKQGHQVVGEFVDKAKTGRTSKRPQFLEMVSLARSKQHPIDAIIVWKYSRFARNREDAIVFKSILRRKEVQVISIKEQIDDSPSGHLLEGIIEVLDEFYSANLAQDVKRGMRENASRGLFNGSKTPYGMCRVAVSDNGKERWRLEPGSEESIARRAVRRQFALALEGTGCKRIAGILNEEGYAAPNGGRWDKGKVYNILTNETYAGALVWGARSKRGNTTKSESPIRVENAWPGIVTTEEFARVKSLMSENSPRIVHPRTVPSSYLLSGILYCSCGRAMTGRSAKSHRYHYYQCTRRFKEGKEACDSMAIPKDSIESAVIHNLKSKVLTPTNIDQLLRLVNEEFSSIKSALKKSHDAIDSQENEARTRLAKLYDVLETGKLELDDIAPRIREIRSRLDELRNVRIQAEARAVAEEAMCKVDMNALKTHVADLRGILSEASHQECKSVLRSFIKQITVDNGSVMIEYNLPLPSSELPVEKVVLPIERVGRPCRSRTCDTLIKSQSDDVPPKSFEAK